MCVYVRVCVRVCMCVCKSPIKQYNSDNETRATFHLSPQVVAERPLSVLAVAACRHREGPRPQRDGAGGGDSGRWELKE